jgi:hypothetical protein
VQVNPFCELMMLQFSSEEIKHKQYLTDSFTNLTFDAISSAVSAMQSVIPIMRKKGGGIIVT